MKTAATAAHSILSPLFDPAQGWPFSEEEVPLTRGKAPDGNPFIVVSIDGREIVVTEKTAWAGDDDGSPSPHRIVAFLAFAGVAVSEPRVLLQENLGTHGLPSWGMDDDGDLTLSISVLVGEGVPLDVTRRQLMVGLGLIAETVDRILLAVNRQADDEEHSNGNGSANGNGNGHPDSASEDDEDEEQIGMSGELTRRFLTAL